MAFVSPDPVASGKPYAIHDVAEKPPTSLADFVGETAFTLRTSGGVQRVSGVGSTDGDSVRFHEKDIEHTTKDVRVWRISRTGAQGFTAESTAAY